MNRGEVWWAELEPPFGRRPVVLLSREESYARRSLVIVASITTRARGIQAEVALGPEHGLPRPCVVNTDVISTIGKSRLRRRITSLTEGKLDEVDRAVHFALGLRH